MGRRGLRAFVGEEAKIFGGPDRGLAMSGGPGRERCIRARRLCRRDLDGVSNPVQEFLRIAGGM